MGSFCDVSGNNFVPIFRVSWCADVLVAPKLMTRCPALPCVYVEKYTAQGRTHSHQFCFHQHTNTPARQHTLKMESVAETSRNLHILTLLSARENCSEFCRHVSFKFIYVKTIFVLLPKCFFVIVYLTMSIAQQRRITR